MEAASEAVIAAVLVVAAWVVAVTEVALAVAAAMAVADKTTIKKSKAQLSRLLVQNK